ncbi:MAG: hypothetical protein ACRDCW_06800 [Sarcina sp.]
MTTEVRYVKLTEEAFQLMMVKIECLSTRICELEKVSPDTEIPINLTRMEELTADWCTTCTPDPAPTPVALDSEKAGE